MKTDKYLEMLLLVVAQARTDWDLERMEEALKKARSIVALKRDQVRQAEFKRRNGL